LRNLLYSSHQQQNKNHTKRLYTTEAITYIHFDLFGFDSITCGVEMLVKFDKAQTNPMLGKYGEQLGRTMKLDFEA